MADLLSYAEVQKLINELGAEHKKLVEDIVPTQITITGIQCVVQTLLTERISIRDLPTIMVGIAEAVGHTQARKRVAQGQSVAGRGVLGGRRHLKTKNKK